VLTVDGQGTSQILSIQSGADVTISGLTLAHGKVDSGGGGAVFNAGTLDMVNCTVRDSSAQLAGGIANDGGTLTMTGCTVSGNSASLSGGGVLNYHGTLDMANCTVYGNTALANGGGVDNEGGPLTLDDCTVAGNSAASGGGLSNVGQFAPIPATLNNTIVANSISGGDIFGPVTGSHDLIDDANTAGGLTNGASGNHVGVAAMLGPLHSDGGPTQTIALLPHSPAINAGDNASIPLFVTTDQRGAPRIKGGTVDIGAVESGPINIVVTTLTDQDTGTLSSSNGSGTSLRDAINFANADPYGDTITFSPLLKGALDLAAGSLPAISATLTIQGPGANVLTVDGQGTSQILSIQSGADVTISGLTLAHGKLDNGGGGAVFNAGTLDLVNCTVRDSSAPLAGGIVNDGGTLTMTGCTVSGNTASLSGGGVFNAGTLDMVNCTVYGNTAQANGGGVENEGKLTLDDCTVAGNSAASGGGLANLATATLHNTIVANSTSGGDILGPVTGSNNLIDDAASAGGLTNGVKGNRVGVAAMLGPLAYNGGPTQTIALFTGSPAIGKAGAVSVTADQRGFPLGSPPDIGAFQYQGPSPTATFSGPTTGTVQVQATFTFTATDPTPADQDGTFTYTVDWNGDGSDMQSVQGPASVQVVHSYAATGSFTPSVTVVDQDHRVSSPVALAAPVVVSALASSFGGLIASGPVTITAANLSQVSTALGVINAAPPNSWMNAQAVNLTVTSDAVLDPVINPTSPNATINVSGSTDDNAFLSHELGGIVDFSNADEGVKDAATVATLVALAVIGAAGVTDGLVAGLTDLGEYIDVTTDEIVSQDDLIAALKPGVEFPKNWVQVTVLNTGLVHSALSAGLTIGVNSIPYAEATSFAIGASPALTVDQGTVNWSDSIMGTATDSPTILVKGGTLTLKKDWIMGNADGTQPLIEVDGGSLVLGAPDGTQGNYLGAYGSRPFVHVTGTGMVLVEGGNTSAQLASNFTAQAAGATTIQLASSAPVTTPGQMVTYTATVTAAGAPESDGSVEFFDYTTKTYLGTSALTNGSAALQVTPTAFTAGDRIVATYLPTTGALVPSSGQVTQAVVAATTTGLTGPSSTPVYGQSVTFTATITDTTPSGRTPIGSVEFYDGSTDLGPGTVLSGSGSTVTSTFTTAKLAPGMHTIKAVYAPSGAFQSGSETLKLTIGKDSTTTGVTSSIPGNASVYGQSVTFTATVAVKSPGAGTPTGVVTFYDNGVSIGTGTLNGVSGDDQATFTTTKLSVAGHTITASYGGDTDDIKSSSGVVTQTVSRDASTTTPSASTTSSSFGQAVTLAALVTANAPGAGTPTGSVSFVDLTTGNNVGTSGLSGGAASLKISTLEPGAHVIEAIYGGDGNFRGSNSSQAITVTVGAALYALSPSATGALEVTGGAGLDETGPVYVDSSSASAIVATGGASVTATHIDVVGRASVSGGAKLSPNPVTGAGSEPDALAGLAVPAAGPARGAVNLGGSSVLTINPGVYSAIIVAGNARLTMKPGIYEIAGGGLTVSDGGKVTGAGVLIYIAGSKYPSAGGTFGAVNLSGSASVHLTAPTKGTYAGIVLFQSRDNAQTISISGSAVATFAGTIYAPAATVSVTGSARFAQEALVANELRLQGIATTTGATAGLATAGGAASRGVLGAVAGPASGPANAGPLPASAASSSANLGPSVMPTGGPGAAARAATSVVVSYGPASVSPASGSEDDNPSSYLDSEALADVAVSLVNDRGNGVRRATGHG
jgi:hypothetical protein